MNRELYLKYSPQLSAITAAVVAAGIAGKAASEASKGRKDSLAASIRDFAEVTHADGVPVDEANKMLALDMTLAEVKGGTIKGYGASLRGYRAMIAAGVAIADKNTKDAQDYVASDEVKAIKAAKDRIATATKGYKLADWLALADVLEAAKAAREADAQPGEAEVAEVAAQAANG